MTGGLVAAVDLGASSGRVMVGRVAPGELELTEIRRFPNEPTQLPDGLHWDILRLYHDVLAGLREAARAADDLVSIGIDTWGVDYGLLDEAGALLGDPFHYRDGRTAASIEAVHAVVPPKALYARTGLQFLPFNTIYQLAAARGTSALELARTMLLIPDLLGYWLSGVRVAEVTNASTTGLLDVHRRTWDDELSASLGIPPSLFAPLGNPGDVIGPLLDDVRHETGVSEATRLTLVGSHDTASAVVAVPADVHDFAYIACGTWSLVGLELDRAILTEDSRQANFTNEGGVDDRIRFLRNVMGLWLLQESLRTWDQEGHPERLPALLMAAGELPPGGPVIDPDDASFLPPGDMPARIAAACRRLDQPVPATRPGLVRCILDSLAAGLQSCCAGRRATLWADGGDRPPGGRWGAQLAPVPAHRRCLRGPGGRRPGRSHRARKCADPGPSRRAPGRRSRVTSRARPVDAGHPALRATRVIRQTGGVGMRVALAGTVPEAVARARVDPARTPGSEAASTTSNIEPHRVEGVHGPRGLQRRVRRGLCSPGGASAASDPPGRPRRILTPNRRSDRAVSVKRGSRARTASYSPPESWALKSGPTGPNRAQRKPTRPGEVGHPCTRRSLATPAWPKQPAEDSPASIWRNSDAGSRGRALPRGTLSDLLTK